MFTNAGTIAQALPSQPMERFSYYQNGSVEHGELPSVTSRIQQPYVEILEQPVPIGARFRYKCEGRSAGCIKGINSTDKLKTYPTIKIHGYQGAACVIVSCVTKDGPPYYPHPHNLVGKTCSNGVCYKSINTPDMICNFTNLGIQCVKKKDVKESLSHREAIQVDPFGTGFCHYTEPNKINLNALRLCFQVFLPDEKGKLSIALHPVISNPIFDNKTVSDLTITKLSHNTAPVTGGLEMILLCNQVNKDDIQILFYEESGNHMTWCAHGRFEPHHVHRKAAISFQTPQYKVINLQHPIECFIQLRRPSDGAVGQPRNFTLSPLIRDPEGIARKRSKFEALNLEQILQATNLIPEERNVSDAFGVPRTIKHAVRTKSTFQSSSHKNSQETVPCEIISPAHLPLLANPSLNSNLKHQPILSPANQVSVENQTMEELLAVAKGKIGLEPIHTFCDASNEETFDKLSSLDLGIDPNDLDVNLSGITLDSFNESTGLNFSHSMLEVKSERV